MFAKRTELFDLFMPLVQALHEKKVIDLAELPHYYEDSLMRRVELPGQKPEDLAFLKEVIQGLHRLAVQVKAAESQRPS